MSRYSTCLALGCSAQIDRGLSFCHWHFRLLPSWLRHQLRQPPGETMAALAHGYVRAVRLACEVIRQAEANRGAA